MSFKIAIDGPSGAGKTTLAKSVAKKLGFTYIDTGAMYRTVGLYMLNNGIDINNEKDVVKELDNIKINLKYKDGIQLIFLNGKDVSSDIRMNEVSHAASVVSVYKDVREKLVFMQRELAKSTNVVMDGRDIGTNVLKDANIKIFLTADVKMRAIRRMEELREKGINKTVAEVEEELKIRDDRDMNRENNPLKKAEDAIELDTTNMKVEEEVNFIINLYNERKGEDNENND